MELEKHEAEYFKKHEKMPMFSVTADVGCDQNVLLPAITADGDLSFKPVLDHLEMILTACPASELFEYLDSAGIEINRSEPMTREQYENLSEFDGC